jgi:hypothetical protein
MTRKYSPPLLPAFRLCSGLAATLIALHLQAAAPQNPDKEEWVDLFNGKDLTGWSPKVRGYPLGENPFNTFRVENGILQARYDQYPEFDNRFGHIFYNQGPYSHYKIQVEYRFVGDQVKGGPAWAFRNNGIMYHTQDPKTMKVEQDFPGSMEYQLLGGNGKDPRTTGNLCTPGTHVVFNGQFTEDHIINSSSETFHGDQWVTAELVVYGSERAEHYINGKKVLEYTGLQWDDRTPNGSGYIALQAESHPTDFRAVRLLNLEGCMDKKAKNYKTYFVKDNPKACVY